MYFLISQHFIQPDIPRLVISFFTFNQSNYSAWVRGNYLSAVQAESWLSPREFLCQRTFQDENHHDYLKLSRYDFISKIETPLPKLSNLINASSDPRACIMFLSHDGKRVLWIDTRSNTPETHIVVASLNGLLQSRGILENGGIDISWLGDNRQFIAIGLRQGAYFKPTIGNGDHEQLSKTYILIPAKIGVQGSYFISTNNQLIFNDMHDPNRNRALNTIRLDVYEITKGIRPLQTFHAKIPMNTHFAAITFSPDGKRIAWLIRYQDQHSWIAWISRYIPIIKYTPSTTESIWVSNINGSDMHEIGHILKKRNFFPLRNIGWSPDGKTLSFHYDFKLWTVPAD